MEHESPVCLTATTFPCPSSEDQERPGPSYPSGSGLGQECVIPETSGHEQLSSDQAALREDLPLQQVGSVLCPGLSNLHLDASLFTLDSGKVCDLVWHL